MRVLRYLLLLILPASAQASYFEFCELAGTIVSEPARSPASKREVLVRLQVESVRERRDRELRVKSYTDCSQYVGTTVTFDLPLPGTRRMSSMRAGDTLSVLRSIYDGGNGGNTVIKFISHEAARAGAQ